MGNGFWSQHRWTKEERSRQEVALPIGHEHGEDEERNLKKENGFFLILKIKLMTISFFFLNFLLTKIDFRLKNIINVTKW